jgi:glycosyltransferase involved in cell wall biosynthesis
MLSRLQKIKGVAYFLEAAARVGARVPEAHFLLVGDAFIRPDPKGEDLRAVDESSRARIRDTAAKLGIGDRLHLTGVRKDVPAVLAASAVSVLPSLSEGTSNTLLESMAAGVPVVATAVGGTPEVIEHGINGLLVAPRDAGALADAICELLLDRSLAQRIGAEGRRTVVSHYSMERMVRETADLYANLLDRRVSPY